MLFRSLRSASFAEVDVPESAEEVKLREQCVEIDSGVVRGCDKGGLKVYVHLVARRELSECPDDAESDDEIEHLDVLELQDRWRRDDLQLARVRLEEACEEGSLYDEDVSTALIWCGYAQDEPRT